MQWEKFSKVYFAAGLRRLVAGEVGWEKEKHPFVAQRSSLSYQNLPISFIISEDHFHSMFKLFLTLWNYY